MSKVGKRTGVIGAVAVSLALVLGLPAAAQSTGGTASPDHGFSDRFDDFAVDDSGFDAPDIGDAGIGASDSGTDLAPEAGDYSPADGPELTAGALAPMGFTESAPAEDFSGATQAQGRSNPASAPAPARRARAIGPSLTMPAVVELFTSQGCSACPPADALLAGLTDRDDVLALAFHVDYWDYLGWTDMFARPEFTARQKGYARLAGERSIYTPQMIVNGTQTLASLRPADLVQVIADHRARPSPLTISADTEGERYRVDLVPQSELEARALVLLVRYLPKREVALRGGENRGKTMDYFNIVTGVEAVADWDGRAAMRLTVSPGAEEGDAASDHPADTRHAIVVQLRAGRSGRLPGPIVAALKLD